jgi:hypothetical protein
VRNANQSGVVTASDLACVKLRVPGSVPLPTCCLHPLPTTLASIPDGKDDHATSTWA